MSAAGVAALLSHPSRAAGLDTETWTGILCAARAELLLASLAHRLDGLDLPDAVQSILDSARTDVEAGRTEALWEAEMARRALGDLGVPVVLLKGTAFVAAGLDAGQGRNIGDLDILVPRDRLGEVEAALIAAGWEWVKPDPYDDDYYRLWMHELPPLIHRDRDRMIDVHHTILPPTARPTPDAAALIAASVPLENGLRVLCPEDMIVHAAAHLLADGDLAGGLRNLWDIDRLLRDFDEEGFAGRLRDRAAIHRLSREVARALRLSKALFATPVAPTGNRKGNDHMFRARLLARDGWGRPTRPLLRLMFYIRSHWLRMPPLLLARHLWTKWRKTS
ncbi:nucleotidyltransferase family protein [Sphingomonas sp. SUN039]|uniref:nucleotidyltransferase domain-containing protein n=1 Tax=Sphingomonas sp. SUN039 TaxID=2937787 RepID=UPI0021643021|nr:nucleotidyltransferase family protein [Sphingomonas sp. SUN039]UVO54079.1 nucleotidyltransferase family protein [Sphingomonas sp. SUN039]